MFKPAECVTVYLQVFVTDTRKLSVFFLNVCLSLTRALTGRLWESFWASALKLRIHLFCVQLCCLEVLALPLTSEVMLALVLLTTLISKPKGILGWSSVPTFAARLFQKSSVYFFPLGTERHYQIIPILVPWIESLRKLQSIYLVYGISWGRRDKLLLPSRAMTAQQDGWGLEYFVSPFHKGALPVSPAVCYFNS